MNTCKFSSKPAAAILAGIFSLSVNMDAAEADESREKPVVLLESVKKRELESQLTMPR